jgi:hypothetical protein
MRKLFVGALALGLMTAYTVMPSFAANIKDVNANYWGF